MPYVDRALLLAWARWLAEKYNCGELNGLELEPILERFLSKRAASAVPSSLATDVTVPQRVVRKPPKEEKARTRMPRVNGVPTVVCRICGSRYIDGFLSDTQAAGCAAGYREHVGRKLVWCHYESTFDADLYEFTDSVPDAWHKANPICDLCIAKAVRVGLLVKLPGEYVMLQRWTTGIIGEGEPEDIQLPPMPRKQGKKL